MNRFARWVLFPTIALAAAGCDDDDHHHHHHACCIQTPVVSAADLNLDGFADLVIGAPGDPGGGTQRGAVFIHFGSAAGPSPTPSLTIFGPEDGSRFGSSIAFVGDVNGHGAPDLLVGAPLDDADGNTSDDHIDRGRAFIFFGGPAMDAVPDVTMSGAEEHAEFGSSVARIADTNGDGFDDWIVGAPGDDGDGNATDDHLDRGRAFFFYGSFTPDGVADVVFTGPERNSEFGLVVESAGDINNGGAEDIAVGAPLDDGDGNPTNEGTDRGRVYVFYGGSILDATPDLILTGNEIGAQFGSAVAPALDVDGDGIDDLLVGAPLHDAGGNPNADRGEAYVFRGGNPPDAVADLTLQGSSNGGFFGGAVSRAGDVNGDGQRDFLVGAPLEDPPSLTDAGRAYLFFGGPAADATPDVVFSGADAHGHFGATVAGPGDLNGGGRDVFVGAPLDDAGGVDRGRTFVFFGGSVLDSSADATISGSQNGALAGTAIAN